MLSHLRTTHEKTRDALLAGRERSEEELFFLSMAAKVKKMPADVSQIVQLQVMQLVHNASNRHLPPVPLTPLPPVYHPDAHFRPLTPLSSSSETASLSPPQLTPPVTMAPLRPTRSHSAPVQQWAPSDPATQFTVVADVHPTVSIPDNDEPSTKYTTININNQSILSAAMQEAELGELQVPDC